MSVLPTPTESQTSLLSAGSRTLIQTTMEDWCGSYGPRLSGDSLSILRSGINQISTLVDVLVSTGLVRDLALESLEMGDGDVDLVELASKITKRMVSDVCAELKSHLPDS